MNRRAPCILGCALLAALLVCDAATAQKRRGDRRRYPSEPTYAVVRVGDDVRVVQSDGVDPLLEWVEKRNAERMKAYREAYREATRRERREMEAPDATETRVLEDHVRSREEAEVLRARFLALLRGGGKGSYVVIELGGQYHILSKAELPDLRRTLDTEYRRVLAEYEEQKAEAEEAGREFEKPRPVRAELRVFRRKFTTPLEAELYVRERIRKEEEARGDRDQPPRDGDR